MDRPYGLLAASIFLFSFPFVAQEAWAETVPTTAGEVHYEARCSFHSYVKDLNDHEVEACAGPAPGCRATCTGLSLAEDAENPTLAAGDLLVEGGEGAVFGMKGERKSRPISTKFSERLKIWNENQALLKQGGTARGTLEKQDNSQQAITKQGRS